MTLEKTIRAFVPSTASLTYHPLFKIASRLFDIVPQLLFRELRHIPPNYMRIRIGAGNRLFANHISYLVGAKTFWFYMLSHQIISARSTIVDIGSGCGRFAHHMRDYAFKDERFTGQYYGIDIDKEMLQWCEAHFDRERFTFIHSSHASKTYENAAPGERRFTIPINDNSVDLVFSTSLYTHLLESEVENYTQEACRILKSGGTMAMYVFSMNSPPPTFGTRHTFAHRIGLAYVESLANPEAAVAYEDAYLIEVAKRAGFAEARIVTVAGEAQPMLVARKN